VEITVLLCGLAVGVLVCTWLSERIDVPAPFLLIAAGIAASYVPGVPEVELTEHVVLYGLLPPLLYAAAQSTSLVDFNANRRPILLLSVGLVLFTTAGVGIITHALLPGVSWAIALAIGAVVAPPDAVAATAIARRIGLPRRITTILEGESLLNDATALVALRTAVAATTGVGLDAGGVLIDFVVAAGGGVLVGYVLYKIVAKVRRHLGDPELDSALSLVVPFAAYVAAEKIHASGVIAVVVAGLLLGHSAPKLQTAQSRIAERLNWRTIGFVLENAVFLLIGLQARWIIDGAAHDDVSNGRIAAVCLAALGTVMLLRMVWVFPARYVIRTSELDDHHKAPLSNTFILGWAGMRGVVTLAAAFVIPEHTENREVLLMMAFTVVAGTLFLQGMSLGWLTRRLRVLGPDPSEDALARATLLQQASKAAF
jgi:monovalent cation/hydrogen antiporter